MKFGSIANANFNVLKLHSMLNVVILDVLYSKFLILIKTDRSGHTLRISVHFIMFWGHYMCLM